MGLALCAKVAVGVSVCLQYSGFEDRYTGLSLSRVGFIPVGTEWGCPTVTLVISNNPGVLIPPSPWGVLPN